MIAAPIPDNEQSRLMALAGYQILQNQLKREFDEVTALAAEVCQTSMSAICMIGKNAIWYKSCYGFDVHETTRATSFCSYVINTPDEVFIVEDATQDIRFHDNPLVIQNPHIKSYAGAPLMDNSGYALGALCVLDSDAKKLTKNQIKSLKSLAEQTMRLLSSRVWLSSYKQHLSDSEDMTLFL